MKPFVGQSAWSIFLMVFIAAAGCDSGNGYEEQTYPCGEDNCNSAEQCINQSLCSPPATKGAMACVEVGANIYGELEAGDLSCHNRAPCTGNAECPTDASGAQMACRSGFCAIAAPTGPALPPKVTFRGCVDAFGIEDTTYPVMRVALYTTEQDPTGPSNWDLPTLQDIDHCEYQGAFEFTDVPTNTPLILKTYDELNKFVVTYKYNLVLWADLAKDDGTGNFVFDTRDLQTDPRTGLEILLEPWRGYAVSQATYTIILKAVYISKLPLNQGAVAGTIRDCRYREMNNVRCGVVDQPQVLTYFTNAENPRPDSSRDSTHTNGIYAAIGLTEGAHRLSCLAQDPEGMQVPLGEYGFQVFPHAITIISFDWYPGVQ